MEHPFQNKTTGFENGVWPGLCSSPVFNKTSPHKNFRQQGQSLAIHSQLCSSGILVIRHIRWVLDCNTSSPTSFSYSLDCITTSFFESSIELETVDFRPENRARNNNFPIWAHFIESWQPHPSLNIRILLSRSKKILLTFSCTFDFARVSNLDCLDKGSRYQLPVNFPHHCGRK